MTDESPDSRIDAICEQFEGELRQGRSPHISDFLRATAAERKQLLAELLRLKIDYARRNGDEPKEEAYLDEFPDDQDVVRDVLTWAAEAKPVNQVSSSETPLAAYMNKLGAEAQPDVFADLLRRELERRAERGDTPTPEEYEELWPELATVIQTIFRESTVEDSDREHEPSGTQTFIAPSSSEQFGKYRKVAELGSGGMGAVFEVQHLESGQRVALKTLPIVDGAKLHRFKREFRSLADVNHPNIIGLHTLERSERGIWFITMDIVEGGVKFLDYVRPDGILDLEKLRHASAQLATAVHVLHSQRPPVIHRDLKPSNVLVKPDGTVIVLDFGLVQEGDDTLSVGKIAGTPAYMAPEQASSNTPVSEASDWYALGVMLYEALTGKPPFRGGAPLEIIVAKSNTDAPPVVPSDHIPADLAQLTNQLLARKVDDRANADVVLQVLCPEGNAAVEPQEEEPLVGRASQLRELDSALRHVRDGAQALAVFVHGKSGEGKSILCERFVSAIDQHSRDTLVMSGRCYDRESVPFKALDALVDSLAAHLRSLASDEAALLLPRDIFILAHVFPVLQRVTIVAKASQGRDVRFDEAQIRARAFAALRELLQRMTETTTLVWLIDDLQWGDSDSAEALFEVLKSPESPRLLLLGTYRSDEVERSEFLATWKQQQEAHNLVEMRTVSVGPLSPAECAEVIANFAHCSVDDALEQAHQLAAKIDGNPLLLTELVRAASEATSSNESQSMGNMIAAKLARLPSSSRELLEVIAASGQAIRVVEASEAAGQTSQVMATLSHMRNERLIKIHGAGSSAQVDTYHDKIRETIYAELDSVRRRDLHDRLANAIERQHEFDFDLLRESIERLNSARVVSTRFYDLAYHFDLAGRTERAWVYGLVAAEQARQQSSPEVAAQQFKIAHRNSEGLDVALRYRIAYGSGEALLLIGDYQESRTALNEVFAMAEDAYSQAKIEELLGQLALKEGRIMDATESFESGLRRLGRRVPRSAAGYTSFAIVQAVVQITHSLLPRLFTEKRGHMDDLSELRLKLFLRLFEPYMFKSPLRAFWSHLAAMNHAEKYARSAWWAWSYSAHACFLAMVGLQRRGNRYGKAATQLAEQVDDLWVQGFANSYPGMGLFASAMYGDALDKCDRGRNCYAKAGDKWWLHLADFHACYSHFGLGELRRAGERAKELFDSCSRIGDSRLMCTAWLLARTTSGKLPFPSLKAHFPNRPDDVMSNVHGWLAESLWHLAHERPQEAVGILENAFVQMKNNNCYNSHTMHVVPMMAAARRHLAHDLQKTEPDAARQEMNRSVKWARWATRVSRFAPLMAPLALREFAQSLEAQGKLDKAYRMATKSCRVAKKQDAKFEYAQSLLVCSRIGVALQKAGAHEQLEEAQRLLAGFAEEQRAIADTDSFTEATAEISVEP